MVLLPCSRVLFESFRCSLKKNLCNTRVYVYDDDDDDAIILERGALRVRTANWTGEDSRERTVVVEEVLYTFRLVFIVRDVYDPIVPRRFGGFAQVLQTVQVAFLGRPLTRRYVKLIILTLNKIFEYVEMTILSRP